MALSANSIWEIRTGGSDTNGGVYDSTLASAGTDYSQQNSAQLSLTDVVTVSSTTVTSVTGGFTSAMIANGINIAGTCFQITAVASTNSITVDRATGTGTGQTGKVGGACATPGYVAGQQVSGNWVYWGGGNYTAGNGSPNTTGAKVGLSAGGTLTRSMRWIGYGSARGDLTPGAGPIFTAIAGGSGALFSSAVAPNIVVMDNIICDAGSQAYACFSGAQNHRFLRCKALHTTTTGFTASTSGCSFYKCEATLCATGFSGRTLANACSSHGNTGVGMAVSGGITEISNCEIYANGSQGMTTSVQTTIKNCTFQGNTSNGLLATLTTAAVVEMYDCIIYGNGAVGVGNGNSNDLIFAMGCAAGSNTGGNFAATINQEGSITLTADPFTNAAGGDLSLNGNAGGGALCRNSGASGAIPAATTPGYPDVGALQHAGSSQFGVVRPAGTWVYVG